MTNFNSNTAIEEQPSSSQLSAIDIGSLNFTDEEKEQLKISHEGANSMRPETSDRPFLDTVLSALDCSENDYLALLGLCLIYALANNKGKSIKFIVDFNDFASLSEGLLTMCGKSAECCIQWNLLSILS